MHKGKRERSVTWMRYYIMKQKWLEWTGEWMNQPYSSHGGLEHAEVVWTLGGETVCFQTLGSEWSGDQECQDTFWATSLEDVHHQPWLSSSLCLLPRSGQWFSDLCSDVDSQKRISVCRFLDHVKRTVSILTLITTGLFWWHFLQLKYN